MGELKDKAKGIGNVKQATGRATDDTNLEAKGTAQERKGEGQNLKGQLMGAVGDKV